MGDQSWAKTDDFSGVLDATCQCMSNDLLGEMANMQADAEAAGVDINAKISRMGDSAADEEAEQKKKAGADAPLSRPTVCELAAAGDAEELERIFMRHDGLDAEELGQYAQSPDNTTETGWPAVCLAAFHGNVKAMHVLIDANADLDARLGSGASALTIAAQQGYATIVRILINGGASVSATRSDSRDGLLLAAQAGHADVTRTLVAAGAWMEAREGGGSTPLFLASQEGHTETAQVLVAARADLAAMRSDGMTPVMMAAVNGHAETLRVLVYAGATTDSADASDVTGLSAGARARVQRAVSELTAQLADVAEACAQAELRQRSRLARITGVESMTPTVTEENVEISSERQRRRIAAVEEAQNIRRARLRVQDRNVTDLERRFSSQLALEAELRGGHSSPTSPEPRSGLAPELIDIGSPGTPRSDLSPLRPDLGSPRSEASSLSSDEDGFRTADEVDEDDVSPGSAT